MDDPPDRSTASDHALLGLNDLAEAAAVSVRTVRYYIGEGLLPPPVGHGPRSGYTEGHLDRLRLIGRLKDAYLPLREIRRRVAGLDDDQVRTALEQIAREPAPDGAQLDSAADYIARITGPQTQARARVPPGETSDGAAMLQEHIRPEAWPASGADEIDSLPALTEPVSWRRLPIADDAELLIQEDTYQRRAEQIEALIDWARRVLR